MRWFLMVVAVSLEKPAEHMQRTPTFRLSPITSKFIIPH